MSKNQLSKRQSKSVVTVPQEIVALGRDAAKAFLEFFTAQIRNENTRAAYGRNVLRYLRWLEEQGVPFAAMQAVHVAGYIEHLASVGLSAPTVKQHLAAIRMLCGFLVVRQIIPENPTLNVRGPKHVVTTGTTPAFEGKDARALMDSMNDGKPGTLRDRALMAVMIYSFGRISAVLALDASDYYQVGSRRMLRLKEKGGRDHQMPVHHTAVDYLDAYLAAHPADKGPLFRTLNRQRSGFTDTRFNRSEAWAMIKRRCRKAGLGDKFSNHSFRATGITAFLKNDGQLEQAQYMAAHASPRTTKLYDRRRQEATLDEVERIIL